MTGPFGDGAGLDDETEYGGLGGGFGVRAAEVAKGRDLPNEPGQRIGMVYRAPTSGEAALEPVDPATGLPAVTENPS